MTILVSCSHPDKATPYLEALRTVGIGDERVRVVTPDRVSPADAAALAADAAGLLLCGGPDLEPHRYGEAPLADANLSLMPTRDAVELELLAGARTARTPTFGICRGLQTINVFLGGSLLQDIPLQWPAAVAHDLCEPRDLIAHDVQVTAPHSELGALLGDEARSNSRHHQAIKDLAPGLRVVATAPDGIVEAVEGDDPAWWLWAVQWHPENLVALPLHRELFVRFRDRAAERAASPATPSATAEPALR